MKLGTIVVWNVLNLIFAGLKDPSDSCDWPGKLYNCGFGTTEVK